MANWTNLKNSIKSAIKQNGNQEITGFILQTILLALVNETSSVLCETTESGFYVIDSTNRVGLAYSENGLDVAKLSSHFVEVAIAAGLGGSGGASSVLISQTEEPGFYVIDSSGKVGLAYDDENGLDVAKISSHFVEVAKAAGLDGGGSDISYEELI